MRERIGPAVRPMWFALLVVLLPAGARATVCDDLCAANADPCVLARSVTVTAASTIDCGNRTLRIANGGTLRVASGDVLAVRAGALAIDSGGTISGRGSSSLSPDGREQPAGAQAPEEVLANVVVRTARIFKRERAEQEEQPQRGDRPPRAGHRLAGALQRRLLRGVEQER